TLGSPLLVVGQTRPEETDYAYRMRRNMNARAFLRISVAILAAAGTLAASHTSAQPAPAARPSPNAALKPLADPKLTVALASPSMTWLPAYVADAGGFFKAMGLDVKMIVTSTGQTTTAAILSGDADIAGAGTQAPLQAFDQGQKTIIFSPGVINNTAVIAASNSWMKAKGLTPKSPIATKVAAMKDATIGVPSIGSGADLLLRYIVSKHGGNPSTMNIAPIWPESAQLTAMQRGRMDVGTIAVPGAQIAENEGVGSLFIDTIHGDAPEVNGLLYTGYVATPTVIQKKREALVRFTAALGMANRLIHADPAKAASIAHQGQYRETDVRLLEQAIKFLAA